MSRKVKARDDAPKSGWLAFAIALIAVGLAALLTWKETDRVIGLDFYQFWMGGQAITRSDISNFYDPDTAAYIGSSFLEKARAEEPSELRVEAAEARQRPEFYSTPVLYAFFALFPTHYETAYYAYVAVLLAALIGGTLLLGRTWGLPVAGSLWIAAVTLLLFEAARAEFRVLNVNSLQFGAVAAFIALRHMRFPGARIVAGAILGAALLFKPNVALIAPLSILFLFAARAWRSMIEEGTGYALGAIAAAAIAALHSGVATWKLWWTAFRNMPADIITVQLGNYSPKQFLDGAIPNGGLILGSLLLVATIVLAVRAARGIDGSFERTEDLVASTALVLMFFLASPMWIHYGILALPLIIWLIAAPVSRNATVVRIVGLAAFAFAAITPFAMVAGQSNGPRMFVMNAGLAIALGGALWMLWLARFVARNDTR